MTFGHPQILVGMEDVEMMLAILVRNIRLSFVLSVALAWTCFPIAALAAPGDVTLEIFAADWSFNPLSLEIHFPHSFMCIEHQLTSGIKEDCYGFYSYWGQIRQVTFSSGDSLRTANGVNWVEASHPFRFVTQTAPCDTLQVFDADRKLTWRLPPYGGPAEITWPGHPWAPFWRVTGVAYAQNPVGLVYGPGVGGNEFCRDPNQFSRVTATFKHNLSSAGLAAVMRTIHNWNSHDYVLTISNCVDFVDAIAISLQLKRPARRPNQSPDDYVKGLTTLNP